MIMVFFNGHAIILNGLAELLLLAPREAPIMVEIGLLRVQLNRFTKEAMVSARDMYGRAIEIDPKFAGAYASLASTHWFDSVFQWRDGPESLRLSVEIAQKALALDDSLAKSHLD